MDTLSYKTISANKATVTKEWVIVDATDQTLGRLGAKVAKLLRGKYKPNFTPHVDCGDNVIIINADKVVLTGNKWNDRIYLRYTGYPGGQIAYSPADLMQKGEDRLSTPAEMSDCGYASYFYQAIRMKYPEYCRELPQVSKKETNHER